MGRINWHDLRLEPLTLWGYSVGVTSTGSPVVKVADRKWNRIWRTAHALALHNEAKVLFFFRTWLERAAAFNHPGVTRQKMKLRNEINDRRGSSGVAESTGKAQSGVRLPDITLFMYSECAKREGSRGDCHEESMRAKA